MASNVPWLVHCSLLGLLLVQLTVVGTCQAADSVILLQGGTVVNHDGQFEADVLIRGELIEAVASDIKAPKGARVIDASGMYVMPGGIDPHTHLDMPFMGQVTCDDFFSGQAAALAGGTTMHIDFAAPVDGDLAKGFEAWQAKASKACMDYSFHMAVNTWNEKVAADMADLVALGINSFKFFMAYKGALMVTDEQLLKGLIRSKELGALPQIHGENGEAVYLWQQRVFDAGITGPEGHALSRPAIIEGEATGRAIRLAGLVGVPLYVVHVMSEDAMEEVVMARKRGQRVIGEAVASGLALEESVMWHDNFTEAAQYVMSPPIKSAKHRDALRQALAGGALQLVGTDHCVFNSSQKAKGKDDFRRIPNGVNGIEERLHVMWEDMVNTGAMSPSAFVGATSTVAAQLFNMYPRKGRIAPGSDADVILLDPKRQHTISAATHHSHIDTNIYEGKRITGKVVVTISRGRVVWEGGQLHVQPGTGRFIQLKPFGPLFEGLDKEDALYGVTRGFPDYRAKKLQCGNTVQSCKAGDTRHEEL